MNIFVLFWMKNSDAQKRQSASEQVLSWEARPRRTRGEAGALIRPQKHLGLVVWHNSAVAAGETQPHWVKGGSDLLFGHLDIYHNAVEKRGESRMLRQHRWGRQRGCDDADLWGPGEWRSVGLNSDWSTNSDAVCRVCIDWTVFSLRLVVHDLPAWEPIWPFNTGRSVVPISRHVKKKRKRPPFWILCN